LKSDNHKLRLFVTSLFVIVFAYVLSYRGVNLMADDENQTISKTKAGSNEGGTEKYETATFAAGCFWGVEAAFQKVKGVKSTIVGYIGGRLKKPTYKDVCSGKTGHAEAVQLAYDPNIVSYEKLLEVFWRIHDPTTRNRQGPDVGTQYRSAIFFHNPQQAAAARLSKAKLQRKIKKRVVTEIKPAPVFYKAEEYHQRYLEKRGKAFCRPAQK
jgi:peptide-methionine (S)-S-oxide reductase